MEFFFVVKATQKSGKQDAVVWFTAKTESRALLQLDVELEDAGIETGRGKDYLKPHRTNFPVVDGLPEESTVDYTWCERFELEEDGLTWQLKAGAAPGDSVVVEAADAALPATLETAEETMAPEEEATVPVEGRSLAVRLAIHLLNTKCLTHVTKEQQMQATVIATGESVYETTNDYLRNLLQAVGEVAEFPNLSLHAEWKMVQAVLDVFPPTEVPDLMPLREFVKHWITAEPDDRSALTTEWKSGYRPVAAITPELVEDTQRSAAAMQDRAINHTAIPFEKRVFGTWLFGLFDQLTPGQSAEASSLELDMDANYAQNVMLACRNIAQLKHVFPETLADLFAAAKSVWPADGKAPLLSNVIAFFSEWIDAHTTGKTSREDVTAKWQKKYGSSIVRTDAGTNAGGGNKTDRNPDYAHNMDTLDVEIALATLPMDFDIYETPGPIHRRAQEIVKKKESPFKEWSAALRSTPGILSFSRAAIFAVVRGAAENVHHFPVSLQTYINANLTESDHEKPTAETLAAARQIDSAAVVAAVIQGNEPVESLDKLDTPFADVGRQAAEAALKTSIDSATDIAREMVGMQLAAERGEFVPGISDPTDSKWIHEDLSQPKQPVVASMGGGMFSIEGLMGSTTTQETAAHEQMETTVQVEDKNDSALSAGEGTDEAGQQTVALTPAEVLAAAAPSLAAASAPEETPEREEAVATQYPEFFEPGRYEGLPNTVYHAANGISSTQVKDARVSLMYFNARHVDKTIARENSKVLDMGNLVHALALQPENLDNEFSVEPAIPEGAFTTTATLREFIDKHNASLPPLLSADDIKALLEEHNATLPAQVPLGASAEETGQSYMALPSEFQRIEEGQKQTAAAMKACIKEYNATLPSQVKTSGSRDALLEQLAIINPDLVAQEAQKPAPLKVSGTKADLIQSVKSVNPDAVFADELLDAWRENPDDKILVTRAQLATAQAIQNALLSHPTAGKFLTHPSRAVEVSYFGIDDETGLEIRVRPDLEIDMGGVRIGFDLKTISMWNVKQSGLRARLHREIIDRDYHLSADMYIRTAGLDQFFWIFVNKDEGYHWIAIVEAGTELLELGGLEYQTTMRAIANAFDTGEWPAPITDDYTDELNDFDVRRLEALRAQA